MKNDRMRRLASSVVVLAVYLFMVWIASPMIHSARRLCPVRPDGTPQASAVPAFARKYGVSCSQCHAGFPVLNAYGRQFRIQGYVRNPGSDEGVLQSEDKQLWMEKIFPWSLVVRSRPVDNGRGTLSNQGAQMGNTAANNPNGFKSQPINDVDFFLAGGDAARKLSWFGEVDANTPSAPALTLSDLKLGYHPSQYFHVVAMRRGFFVDDPYQTISGAETPTIANRATDLQNTDQGSISGNVITATQQTVYGYGQVYLPQSKDSMSSPASIYYAAGASKVNDTGFQSNSPTNGHLRLAFDSGSGWMLGTFGSYGHTGPRDASAFTGGLANFTAAVAPATGPIDLRRKQQFVLGGFDGLWEFHDFAARGAFVYTHDSDPSFINPAGNVGSKGAVATNHAGYVELAYYWKRGDSPTPFLVPLFRENYYTTFNGRQRFNYVTAQLQHFLAPNWKAFVEFSGDTRTGYQNGTLLNPTPLPAGPPTASQRAVRGNRFTIQTEVGF